jgi:outer membrane protein W
MKKILCASVLALATIAAHAQSTAPAPGSLRYVVGVGLTNGGDKLATTYYTDGSHSNIRAGSGGHLLFGVDYRVNQQVSLQANIGGHVHFTQQADNGDADFRRFPVELLAYYHPDAQWRIGGGARLISAPKLHGSGAANDLDLEYKDTVGAVLEAEYFFSPNVGVKLRGVSEKYQPKAGGPKASGDHVGLYGNFYF